MAADKSKKVMDVSKPSETKATPTSKPVIIGHKPAVKDPMVDAAKAKDAKVDSTTISISDTGKLTQETPPAAADKPAVPPSEAIVKKEMVIAPLAAASDSPNPAEPDVPKTEQPAKEETPAEPAENEPEVPEAPEPEAETEEKPEEKPEDEPEPPKPETPAEPEAVEEPAPPTPATEPTADQPVESPDPDKAPVDSVLGDAQSSKEAEVAAAAMEEKLKELSNSNKYKVPVGQPRKHHGKAGGLKGVLIFLLIILLIGAGAALAVDAGLIKTSIKLPFDLIKEKQEDASPMVAAPVAKTPTKTTTDTGTTTTTTKDVPAGFTVYKATDTGLQFAYPTTWGTPKIAKEKGYSKRDTKLVSDGTYAYQVTFAINKDVEMVVTSSAYLPVARGRQYYDYLQWCTQTGKYYNQVLNFKSVGTTDTPDTITCTDGPLSDVTKIDDNTIVQAKVKDSLSGIVAGDIYSLNLTNKALPVLHVKDATMKNAEDIKKMLVTVEPIDSGA